MAQFLGARRAALEKALDSLEAQPFLEVPREQQSRLHWKVGKLEIELKAAARALLLTGQARPFLGIGSARRLRRALERESTRREGEAKSLEWYAKRLDQLDELVELTKAARGGFLEPPDAWKME